MQLIRKQLRDFAGVNQGETIYRLSYDKLFLNNAVYKYDPTNGQVVPSHNHHSSNVTNQ